jgi:hypothetical protein
MYVLLFSATNFGSGFIGANKLHVNSISVDKPPPIKKQKHDLS